MGIYRDRDRQREYPLLALSDDVRDLSGRQGRSELTDAISRHIVELLAPGSSARILDIGCGDASLLRILEREGHQGALTGVLPSPEEVQRLVESLALSGSRIDIVLGDTEKTGLAAGSYDIVIVNGVLHLAQPDPHASLLEFHRLLSRGGTVFLGEIPDRDEFSHHAQYTSAIDYLVHQRSPREFASGAARVARYAFTRRPFLERQSTVFHATPTVFQGMLEAAGFDDVSWRRQGASEAGGQVVESATRWDYTARVRSVS